MPQQLIPVVTGSPADHGQKVNANNAPDLYDTGHRIVKKITIEIEELGISVQAYVNQDWNELRQINRARGFIRGYFCTIPA